MNNIQIKNVDITLSQVVIEDIQYLKQHLDDILATSAQTLVKNLIEETYLVLEKAKDGSKTYQEKHDAFNQLTESWFDAWNHYKNNPDAIAFIRLIDNIINYFIAYSHLCRSLSLINEGRVGEYKADLARIVSGFGLLSEIIDVFIDFFSVSELKQIQADARNAISVSARNVKEYFEKGLELSNLVTQLRAYSSLIILKVEEHINILKDREHGQTMVVATESKSQSHQSKLEILPDMPNNRQRPFGLCAGEFVVPNDFDESLPEDILSAFEGK